MQITTAEGEGTEYHGYSPQGKLIGVLFGCEKDLPLSLEATGKRNEIIDHLLENINHELASAIKIKFGFSSVRMLETSEIATLTGKTPLDIETELKNAYIVLNHPARRDLLVYFVPSECHPRSAFPTNDTCLYDTFNKIVGFEDELNWKLHQINSPKGSL